MRTIPRCWRGGRCCICTSVASMRPPMRRSAVSSASRTMSPSTPCSVAFSRAGWTTRSTSGCRRSRHGRRRRSTTASRQRSRSHMLWMRARWAVSRPSAHRRMSRWRSRPTRGPTTSRSHVTPQRGAVSIAADSRGAPSACRHCSRAEGRLSLCRRRRCRGDRCSSSACRAPARRWSRPCSAPIRACTLAASAARCSGCWAISCRSRMRVGRRMRRCSPSGRPDISRSPPPRRDAMSSPTSNRSISARWA